jgi:hypothetical protein
VTGLALLILRWARRPGGGIANPRWCYYRRGPEPHIERPPLHWQFGADRGANSKVDNTTKMAGAITTIGGEIRCLHRGGQRSAQRGDSASVGA